MAEELWKPVGGFSHYEVSNYGHARHRENKKNLAHVGRIGFKAWVNLWQDGKRHQFCIEEKMWEAFEGPLPEGHMLRRVDGDRDNRKLSNILWVRRPNIIVNRRVSKELKKIGAKDLRWALDNYKYHSRDGNNLKEIAIKLGLSESGLWRAMALKRAPIKRLRPLRPVLKKIFLETG